MPESELKRSTVRNTVFLRRIDPQAGARFYTLVLKRDPYEQVVMVRHWGRIGTPGREMVGQHATEDEALNAMNALAEAKRRRGYQDL